MRVIAVLFVIIALMSFPLSAQTLKAVANYQQEFRMPSRMGGMELSEERREQIAQRMGEIPPREFLLKIYGGRSLYETVRSGDDQARGRWPGMGGAEVVYKDVEKSEFLTRVVFQDTVYKVIDTLAKFDWELHDETMEIGPLVCYKATARVASEAVTMRGGLGGGPATGSAEPAEIVAWYCPEIKSDQGPGKYWGLPGLILQVEEERSLIQCTNIELFPKDFEEVVIPQEGEPVSAEAYRAKLRKFFEERRRERGRRN